MKDKEKDQFNKRRQFLKTAGVGVVSAGALTSVAQAKPTINPSDCQEHSQLSFPCYGVHQAGVVTPHQPFSTVTSFDLSVKSRSKLEKLLRLLTTRIEFLTVGGEMIDPDPQFPPAGSGILGKTVIPDGLSITIGLGYSVFDDRFGLKTLKPKHLQEMKSFANDALQKDKTDGDLVLQICAYSPEVCLNALRDIIKQTSGLMIPRWSMDGFLPKAPAGTAARNLFGFKDGSGNPDVSKKSEADEILWVGHSKNSQGEPAWAKNGSYQAIRIIRHFVEFWDRTPLQEQQTIFGRDKYSGAPLSMKGEYDVPDYKDDPEGKKIPLGAHMRLANPRTPESRKSLMLRRPYDYSLGLAKNGQLNVGLLFICFQANLQEAFINVQKRLDFEDLEEYIKPIGGGYFFVLPGVEKGHFFGESLLIEAEKIAVS